MTINLADNTPRISYAVAEGVTQTSFAVPFEFFDDGDLKVYVDGTLKTITSDYTVSGGDGSTGSITISVTGISGGSTVVITRDIPLARTTDFPTSGAFAVATLNRELDRFTAMQADRADDNDRSIKLKDQDATSSLELPLKADRAGKLLGFNATNGNVEAGPLIADVDSLAGITTDIATLADIEDGTDATDAIQTVAGISANVTTVAGISGNVTTVAGISSNVTSVAGNATNINTVAGNNTNITTVAGISGNVTSVANNASNINTVADETADIATVAGDSADIQTLADISADIQTLADIEDGTDATDAIQTVAGISANVTTVAGIAADIGTVAGISANVTTVAGDSADIQTVAGSIADVNNFADRYRIGATDPATSLDEGDLFYNSTDNALKFYNGSVWTSINVTGIDNLVEDSTPQLGGSLDVNGNAIVSVSDGNIDITPDGTGEVNISKVDIDSGAIDGATIGANSAAAGTFTTLTSTGNAVIGGNLTVNGTTTTINSTTVTVDDLNMVLASGAADAAAANGAGLTVDGASATFTYASTGDKWTMNKDLDVTGEVEADSLTVTGDLTVDTNTLFVDASANEVGIGTSSPNGTLTVRNDSTNTEQLILGNSTNTGGRDWRIGRDNATTGDLIIKSSDATDGNVTTEHARVNASGNVLVGKTTTDIGTAGVRLITNGQIQATASGNEPFFANRLSSDGVQFDFRKDGVSNGSIGSNSGHLVVNGTGAIELQEGGTTRVYVDSGGFFPWSDNVYDIGVLSTARFNDAYITNGVTTGSDQNEKQQILSLTDAEIAAAKRISNGFKTFKWNDAVAAKGDSARKHTGVIAQEVRTALEAEGLDAGDYAFFMSDTWWETQTEVPAVEADEENGIEAQDAYTRTDTYDTADEAPEGATERTRLGIRYPELLAFVGAATEQRLADIESRLTALEA